MISGPQQSGNIRGSNPLIYTGSTPNMIIMNREPLPTDYIEYPIGQWWIIPIVGTFTTGEVWILVSKANNLGTWKKLHGGGGPTPPGNTYLLNRIYITTPGDGTYTPTTGMKQCYVECIGGGGSGSTQSTAFTSGFYANSPGGAGGYTAKLYSNIDIGSSVDYVVGAGGIAPTANADAVGANGNDSTFLDMTAGGGSGSGSLVANPVAPKTNNAGLGGTAIGGDINVAGGNGQIDSFTIPGGRSALIYHGYAGSSFYGAGPYSTQSTTPTPAPVGLAGVQGSGGGCVSVSSGSPTYVIGGNGGNGMIIITEYLA